MWTAASSCRNNVAEDQGNSKMVEVRRTESNHLCDTGADEAKHEDARSFAARTTCEFEIVGHLQPQQLTAKTWQCNPFESGETTEQLLAAQADVENHALAVVTMANVIANLSVELEMEQQATRLQKDEIASLGRLLAQEREDSQQSAAASSAILETKVSIAESLVKAKDSQILDLENRLSGLNEIVDSTIRSITPRSTGSCCDYSDAASFMSETSLEGCGPTRRLQSMLGRKSSSKELLVPELQDRSYHSLCDEAMSGGLSSTVAARKPPSRLAELRKRRDEKAYAVKDRVKRISSFSGHASDTSLSQHRLDDSMASCSDTARVRPPNLVPRTPRRLLDASLTDDDSDHDHHARRFAADGAGCTAPERSVSDISEAEPAINTQSWIHSGMKSNAKARADPEASREDKSNNKLSEELVLAQKRVFELTQTNESVSARLAELEQKLKEYEEQKTQTTVPALSDSDAKSGADNADEQEEGADGSPTLSMELAARQLEVKILSAQVKELRQYVPTNTPLSWANSAFLGRNGPGESDDTTGSTVRVRLVRSKEDGTLRMMEEVQEPESGDTEASNVDGNTQTGALTSTFAVLSVEESDAAGETRADTDAAIHANSGPLAASACPTESIESLIEERDRNQVRAAKLNEELETSRFANALLEAQVGALRKQLADRTSWFANTYSQTIGAGHVDTAKAASRWNLARSSHSVPAESCSNPTDDGLAEESVHKENSFVGDGDSVMTDARDMLDSSNHDAVSRLRQERNQSVRRATKACVQLAMSRMRGEKLSAEVKELNQKIADNSKKAAASISQGDDTSKESSSSFWDSIKSAIEAGTGPFRRDGDGLRDGEQSSKDTPAMPAADTFTSDDEDGPSEVTLRRDRGWGLLLPGVSLASMIGDGVDSLNEPESKPQRVRMRRSRRTSWAEVSMEMLQFG